VIVERYDRSREVSRTAADAHGVPVRYIWQPTRYTRPLVESEPHNDGPSENYTRRSHALISHFLPDDVIDLSDALSGTDAPLFTDDVHHNELAARLVAEALYEQLEPDLRRWADD
jgi:lysophospholipase L1-like esterase